MEKQKSKRVMNLRKLKICIFFLISIVLISAAAADRVYVKGNAASRGVAKGLVGKNHEFSDSFSVEASKSKIALLKAIPGIEIEKVPVFYITAPPFNTCGDGSCQGYENPDSCPEDCGGSIECYPDSQYPWGIQRINGGSGGSGVTVAVLDTGLDTDHPDLSNNVKSCVAFGYAACEDGHGHGTHVSGTVLANGKIRGVAPDASLMAVKVCSDSGSCYDDDVATGIYHAVDNGADIISMSFGGPSLSSVDRL
ncbi:S8 family serine peptidase [Candidatus Woesearchaeota archaeon]|nr:S8 family serine peptidase [Candidatus Woesearchaeota archaeon]